MHRPLRFPVPPLVGAYLLGHLHRVTLLDAPREFVVVVAVMALMVWAGPLATSGTETANPSAGAGFSGSAVIHDDPGNVHRTLMPQGGRY